MRFIAFAYTYHYLNRFSKTGIIRWHVVSQRRIAWLVALWLVSLALYAWSWQWGYVGLLGLSVAHVILEYHDQEEPEAKLPSLSELERSRIIRSVRTDGRDALLR